MFALLPAQPPAQTSCALSAFPALAPYLVRLDEPASYYVVGQAHRTRKGNDASAVLLGLGRFVVCCVEISLLGTLHAIAGELSLIVYNSSLHILAFFPPLLVLSHFC